MKKLAIFFPGIGYTHDKPLMYYSRKIAVDMGYEAKCIIYTNLPENVKGNKEKMKQSLLIAYEQACKQLGDVNFSEYDDIIIIGKSLGTVVAAKYHEEFCKDARVVLYTPVEATYKFKFNKAVAFIGDNDSWSNLDDVKLLSEKALVPLHIYKDANHSLEVSGDYAKNMEYISDVMKKTSEFIKENSSETLLDKIKYVAKYCGKIILNANRTDIAISDKAGKANFVTEYDCKVQQIAKEMLIKILPEADFLGEEEDSKVDESKEYIFIVDPIDGTTNFIKDYHASCISIGLIKNGERYLGVVYNPYLDEMFYAVKGEGAYLNGNKICVSKEELSNGIVVFGSAPYNTELARASFDLAYEYFNKALDIRRSGSAAIDLCSIAAGRAELFFEMLLSPWDFAAGALIVEEAGGIVTTVDGNAVPIFEKTSVLAANKR